MKISTSIAEKPPLVRTGFYTASLLLLVSTNLANALHFVFQGVMKRHLTDADFGLMNSLFAMNTFLALPLAIYTNTLSRHWAELTNAKRDRETDGLWHALVMATLLLSIPLMLVFLPFSHEIARWLQTDNVIAVRVAIVGTGLGVLFSMAPPLAAARQWFWLLAIGVLGAALVRLTLAGFSIHWGVPLSGAVVATFFYTGVITFLVSSRTPWPGWKALPFQKLVPLRGEWFAPALVAVSTFSLSGADMLIVRRFYTDVDSGHFIQVMLLGRIILHAISPLAGVILPKTADSLQPGSGERHVVRRALIFGSFAVVGAALVISLLAPLGFQALRGSSDPLLVRYLRIAVWCLIPISLCQLIIPSLLARRQERILFEFTLLSTLLPAGLYFFRGNLTNAFLVEGTVGTLLLIFIVFRVRLANNVCHET